MNKKTITLDPANQKVLDFIRLTWKVDDKQTEKVLKALYRFETTTKKSKASDLTLYDTYNITITNISRICDKKKGEVINLILSL